MVGGRRSYIMTFCFIVVFIWYTPKLPVDSRASILRARSGEHGVNTLG